MKLSHSRIEFVYKVGAKRFLGNSRSSKMRQESPVRHLWNGSFPAEVMDVNYCPLNLFFRLSNPRKFSDNAFITAFPMLREVWKKGIHIGKFEMSKVWFWRGRHFHDWFGNIGELTSWILPVWLHYRFDKSLWWIVGVIKMADTTDATRRLITKKQTLDDAYAAPANFLEIDVINPLTHGVGKKRYTDYEVRMKVSHSLVAFRPEHFGDCVRCDFSRGIAIFRRTFQYLK